MSAFASLSDVVASEFAAVQKEVAGLLKGRVLIGHGLHHDLKVNRKPTKTKKTIGKEGNAVGEETNERERERAREVGEMGSRQLVSFLPSRPSSCHTPRKIFETLHDTNHFGCYPRLRVFFLNKKKTEREGERERERDRNGREERVTEA